VTDDVKRAVTPNSAPPFEHAHHERTLVLRYFEDDPELTREELLLASALLRTCPWCAALGPEIELIRNATRAMIVPPPDRDFRITPSRARRTRLLDLSATTRRFRAALTTELVRPLAGAAIAVGLVLTVVGAVPYLGNSGGSGAPAPTAAIAAGAPLGAESALGSPDANAAASSIGTEMGTHPQADETPSLGIDTSAETAPPPAPNSLRIAGATPSPSEFPQVAFATLPGPTPEAGVNSAAGSLTQPKSSHASGQEPLPPLPIFGVLLAIVGLLVLGLTVLARRMETNGQT
jgi:hypothetical protein